MWEWQIPAGAEEPDALALAAALREALSELLGVLPDEVFPSFGRSRGPAADTRLSVFLHDQAAGGAGLSTRLSDMGLLIRALSRAIEVLDCREGCNAGCPACVLRPDLNRRSLRMDRLGGLQLARDLLGRLHLPEGLRLLGPSTRLAGRSAEREVLGRLRSGRLREVDIWMHGAPADWELSRDLWPLRSVLPKLRAEGVTVRIHVPEASIVDANLTLPRKLALHACAQEADLHLSSTPPTVGEAPLLMRLDGDAFLVTAPEEGVPGPAWGAGASAPALIGPAPPLQVGRLIGADRLVDLGVGNARFHMTGRDLDGDTNGFGRRFWDWIRKQDPASVTALRNVGADRVTYSDRYLSQPYVLLLLSSVLRAMPGGETRRVVRTSWDGGGGNPYQAHHSVPDEAALGSLLAALSPGVEVNLLEKRELAHERSLEIRLKDGRTLRILLDQGFGAWRSSRNRSHDFRLGPAAQARRLSEADLNVEARSEEGTPITIIMES